MPNNRILKDYYKILGVSYGENDQNVIRNAYKLMSAKLHPEKYKKGDCRDRIIDVNEAYLVLSDQTLKTQYDDYYMAQTKGFNVTSFYFLSSLDPKLAQAEAFTDDFFKKYESYKSRKQKTSWFSGCLVAFLILGALGQFVRGCAEGMREENPPSASFVEHIEPYKTPSDWNTYQIKNAFSISIPSSMEVRQEDDPYTQFLSQHTYAVSNSDVVFQQRNLSSMSKEATNTYCRVLVMYASDYSDEYLRHNETEEFDYETRKVFDDLVNQEVAPYTLISGPSHEWIDINGIKAVQSSYRRQGDVGPVNCKMYILFNYHEMVKIIVAYREKDSDKWEKDMQNVIKTFKWNNPQ